METKPVELNIDRDFQSLCRSLSDDEARLLEQDILDNGCLDPIVTWANHDDTILDGHNRYGICEKHGLPFKTKALNLPTREDAVRWILLHQLARRNLDASQRAMLAAKLANMSHGGDRKSDQAATIAAWSQAGAAEELKVSERSVRSAKKVLDDGGKDLQRAVESGEVAVSVAAAIAELPKSEQKKIVAKGPEAAKAAAKQVKADKRLEFDTKKYDKELAKEKKPGSVKKQWEDKAVIEACGQFAKQIDAAYAGVLKLLDECWANVGGAQPDYERAKRAVAQGKTKSHDALNGVTTAFRMWRPKK